MNDLYIEKQIQETLRELIEEAKEYGEPMSNKDIEEAREEIRETLLIEKEYFDYLETLNISPAEINKLFPKAHFQETDIPIEMYQKILAEYQKTGKPKQSVRKVLKKYLNPKKAKK